MVDNKDAKDCCGCTACEAICPHNAITMIPDALGFKYPKIDKEVCTNCGLCDKICSFNSSYNTSKNLEKPLVFGVRHKDMNEVESSRSGAAFIALSDWILENNGVIYGVGYKEHFIATHKRATNRAELYEFKGSKYVQSNLSGVFKSIKQDLKDGLYVLFSGTPCQTSGLKSYIGEKLSEKLYIIDIVCHGVPAPYIWRDYLKYIENKVGDKAIKVDFRDKTKLGWGAHKESFTFENNYLLTDTYTHLFYKHIMFRHSCGVCHFTNTKRPSDITIADFWGWKKSSADFNIDDKGCSLVFCNTNKGNIWLCSVREHLNVIDVENGNCMQPNLQRPSEIDIHRDEFEDEYRIKGFKYVLFKYGNVSMRYKIDTKTKTYINLGKLICNKIIKKIIR